MSKLDYALNKEQGDIKVDFGASEIRVYVNGVKICTTSDDDHGIRSAMMIANLLKLVFRKSSIIMDGKTYKYEYWYKENHNVA